MKRILKKLLLALGILFLLLNVIIASQAYYFTHFFDKPPGFQETKNGWVQAIFGKKAYKRSITDSLIVPFDNVQLKTSDEILLRAWHAKHDTAATTVILFHGHSSTRGSIVKEAMQFYRMGYDIFMVDFRAHGESDGNNCSIGYNETKDVAAAYRFIEKQSTKPIILWGVSLGASTVTKAIADSGLQPSKVILEMPYGTLHQAVKGFMRTMHLPQEPLATLLCFWGGVWQGFNSFALTPQNDAKKLAMPVLVQWGDKDVRVSEREINTLFENLPSTKKQLEIYPEATHQSLFQKDSVRWQKAVTQFLQN